MIDHLVQKWRHERGWRHMPTRKKLRGCLFPSLVSSPSRRVFSFGKKKKLPCTIYSISMTKSFPWTLSPSFTASTLTFPSMGEATLVSIFIAESTNTGWPCSTVSPTFTWRTGFAVRQEGDCWDWRNKHLHRIQSVTCSVPARSRRTWKSGPGCVSCFWEARKHPYKYLLYRSYLL